MVFDEDNNIIDLFVVTSYNIRNKLKGPTSAVHGQTKYYYTNYPNYDPYLEFNTRYAIFVQD